jgi:uncharacterized LabA/DUF88 family protein
MTPREITQFINNLSRNKDRNIVIVDFANVDKWQESLGWPVGIKQLSQLVKHFATGKQELRRFYYGKDYGPKEKSSKLSKWSNRIHTSAQYNNFEIISKRVKYIPDSKYETGFIKKCNLDIEMAIDLVRMVDSYDRAIIFSGDGDLECVIRLLKEEYDKTFYVFGARDHIGRELIDGQKDKVIDKILFVEDFEYRLNLKRFG